MPTGPSALWILKDHAKNVGGIYVDADYLYTWGPGYVPEGHSYPIDTVFIYDKRRSFEMDGMLVGFGQDINCVTSTDGYIVVGGGGSKDLTGYRYSVLRLYNKETQLLEHDWGGDEYRVTSLFADEKYVYAGTSDSSLLVHDRATMREIKSVYRFADQSPGTHIAADESKFYGGTSDGTVMAWSKATFTPEPSLKADGSLVAHAIAKDGLIYAADASGNIFSWNTSTRAIISKVRAYDGAVRGMALHGKHIFTGDTSGTIAAWDTRDFQKALSFTVGKGAITSVLADDRYLYSSMDSGTVVIWNIADVLNINRS